MYTNGIGQIERITFRGKNKPMSVKMTLHLGHKHTPVSYDCLVPFELAQELSPEDCYKVSFYNDPVSATRNKVNVDFLSPKTWEEFCDAGPSLM